MRWSVAAVLVFLACVKRAPDGSVLKALPRCEIDGKIVRARPLEDAVQSCLRLLAKEQSDSSRSILGLTTNEQGRITTVCLQGSSQEADSAYLNCVADQLERASPVLPPNQRELVWTLNVSY